MPITGENWMPLDSRGLRPAPGAPRPPRRDPGGALPGQHAPRAALQARGPHPGLRPPDRAPSPQRLPVAGALAGGGTHAGGESRVGGNPQTNRAVPSTLPRDSWHSRALGGPRSGLRGVFPGALAARNDLIGAPHNPYRHSNSAHGARVIVHEESGLRHV